jgi:hypothetical protein
VEFVEHAGVLVAALSEDTGVQQAQLGTILEEVEDQMSGVVKKTPPPPPAMPDGRMYPPLPDNITPLPDGGILAKTRGHVIEIGVDGSITIKNKRTGAVEFTK